jgi:hypothetical protein
MMCAFPQIDRDWNYIPPRKDPVNDALAISNNPYQPGTAAYGSYEARRVAYEFPTATRV